MGGSVLADFNRRTVSGVVQMEKHEDQLELVLVAKIGRGSSQRDSPVFGQPMLYVALHVGALAEPAGLVRKAVPMKSLLDEVVVVHRLIWLVAIVVSFAAGSYAHQCC